MTCKYCGSENLIQQLCSEGVHYGKECCADCGKFLRWLPKPDAERPHRPAAHRDLVKKYSDGSCQICQTKESDLPARQTLEAHHLREFHDGGSNERGNLLIVCTASHRWIHWMRTYMRPAAEVFTS